MSPSNPFLQSSRIPEEVEAQCVGKTKMIEKTRRKKPSGSMDQSSYELIETDTPTMEPKEVCTRKMYVEQKEMPSCRKWPRWVEGNCCWCPCNEQNIRISSVNAFATLFFSRALLPKYAMTVRLAPRLHLVCTFRCPPLIWMPLFLNGEQLY